MASSSIAPTQWLLAHGLHDLGIAFFAHVQKKSRGSSGGGDSSGIQSLQLRLASATVNDGNNDGGDSPTPGDSAQSPIEAACVSMQKALDCQTYIVSLFTHDRCLDGLVSIACTDVSQLCHHLRLLQSPLTDDVDAMIVAAGKDENARVARDFKSRVDSLTLAYQPLIKRMVAAAASGTRTFPFIALRDAAKAESQANHLYAWAQTYVPTDTRTDTKTDKAAKLKLIPYIVAMAYAVRVKLDVHFVESSGVDKEERLEYLERSRTVVEQFMEILKVAVLVTIHETSLLEIAMDYSMALTTYMTLMEAMRATVQMALKPKDKLKAIDQWDDGLSGLRAIFQIRDSNTDSSFHSAIFLNNVEEAVKWTQFVGHDLKALNLNDLKNTVSFRELFFVLGADLNDDDDDGTASIRLAPDYKRTLLDLPSADDLRSSLQAKLATAVNVPQSHEAITSFATTRNATQLAAAATALQKSAIASIRTTPLRSHPSSAPLSPRLARTLTGHSSFVYGVAVSGDGQRVVSASYDDTAKVWSATTGQAMLTFNDHSSCVNCVALFSDDTRAVTGGRDETLRMWNINTGTLFTTFYGHSDWVGAVAVSPDERTAASASGDKTVKLWSVHSGQCDATLTGHSNAVCSVAWSADGQTLATGSWDKTIKVWSAGSYSLLRTIDHSTQGGHTRPVSGVAFAGDVLVSCSFDGTIKVWKWQSGTLQTTLSEDEYPVTCVAVFDDNERVASGSYHDTVRIWNLRSGLCEHTLTGHTGAVKSVAVSRDRRTLVSGSRDKSVKVWTLRD